MHAESQISSDHPLDLSATYTSREARSLSSKAFKVPTIGHGRPLPSGATAKDGKQSNRLDSTRRQRLHACIRHRSADSGLDA